MFSEEQLLLLRQKIKARLSEKRYLHTLGVENAAVEIAKKSLSEHLSEIRAAALLHDISKEYSEAEQIKMLNALYTEIPEDDLLSPSVYHSLTAPYVIRRDFPEFATGKVLSSALNHTAGAPDMSLFDEIIFVSDYVEAGRRYPTCIEVRNALYKVLDGGADREECILALHNATIQSLNYTIINIVNCGKFLNGRTVKTRNAFLGRRPMPLN